LNEINNNKSYNDLKALRQELAELLEEDAKADKL
jgi:hypothetical protein